MTGKFTCRKCHASVGSTATVCPGCGFIVADTLPAAGAPLARRQLFPSWLILLAALVGFVAFPFVVHYRQGKSRLDAQAALAADLAGGKLNTPSAFMNRCGAPRWTERRKNGTELHYLVGAVDYYVTLTPRGPRFEFEHQNSSRARPRVERTLLDPRLAMSRLSCR
jgi:hypothetical protein